jgi:DHA2 family multidrug resistance protein
MMPIVGKLLQKGFPPQILNAVGFVLFFVFCLMLSFSSLGSSQADFFWPLVLRGVGLSFLFVPLTTVALSNLEGPDIAQGTGLTNMMRQLGGSFGIALVATYVDRQAWFNRASLLRTLSPYDPATAAWLKQVTAGFVSRGAAPLDAQRKAFGALEGTLSRQVALLTFMDAFRIVGVFFLCCIPLLLLFRRGKRATVDVAVH